MIQRLKPYLPILFIALVAIAFRFPMLDSLPPGLNFDEGGEGVAALDVLHSHFKIWWPIGGGKEPLMAYLVQPLFWLFGPTRLALRLYAALMGVGAVLATYFLAYQLSAFGFQRSAVSDHSPFTIHPLIASLGLATAFWHVAYSRIAFRALSNPMVEALALGFLWLALRSGKWRHFLLAGFFTGGLIYTYLAGRFVPIAVALFFIVEAPIAGRARQKPLLIQYWRKLAGMAGAAALIAAPLGVYFLRHPERFIERAGSVSIFSPAMNNGDFWGTLWRTITATLGTFLSLTGDPNSLGNIPGKPELSPLLAVFFVLGAGFALARVAWHVLSKNTHHASRTTPFLFLLVWWPVMLLPAILAPEGAPHHLRLIGTAPGTYIFVALGMTFAGRWAGERYYALRTTHHAPRIIGWLLLFIVFGFTAWQTYHAYFIRWANDVEHYMDFDVYAEELATQIVAEKNPDVAYVIPMDLRAAHETRHYSLDFLYQEFMQENTLSLKKGLGEGAKSASYFYLPVNEATVAQQLTQAAAGHTALKVVRWTQDKHQEANAKELVTYLLGTGGASFAGRKVDPAYITERYELPSADTPFSLPVIKTPINATLNGLIQVRRAAVQSQLTPSRQVAVAVTYAPIAEITVDYKASLRLIAPNGTVVAQKDRVLLHNWLQGTSLWPREEVNEYYLFPSPTGAIPGVYKVRLVVYHPDTLTPLSDNGQVEIVLGTVQIKPVPK